MKKEYRIQRDGVDIGRPIYGLVNHKQFTNVPPVDAGAAAINAPREKWKPPLQSCVRKHLPAFSGALNMNMKIYCHVTWACQQIVATLPLRFIYQTQRSFEPRISAEEVDGKSWVLANAIGSWCNSMI